MFLQYILLFVLCTCVCYVCGFNSADYEKNYTIAPLDYTVFWKADLPANKLHLALKVKTTGWVGFGIAEITSGSMPGADVMVGYVKDGKGYLSDRWTYDRVEPAVDDCQDLTLVSAEETVDGYTILEVIRRINSTDPQDRSVVFGPNRVIAAFGASDTLAYHDTSRKTDEISFFGAPIYTGVPASGDMTLELRMSDFVVPNKRTVYGCQSFAVPVDQDYIITQIDPIVNQSNVAHVHHFVVHTCINQSVAGDPLVTKYARPRSCSTPLGNVDQGCIGILSAWAAGGGSSYLPAEAGFPMGLKSTSVKFIVLEVHYNNPNGTGGYADNSGIRIHYTTTPRKYDAGVITIGDAFAQFDDIPARSITEYESECLSDCTSEFPHDIIAFQSFPHMHQVGSKMWTTQWREGKEISQIGRIEYWDFNHQLQQEINVTIKRGDRLNTHCVYDTTGSSVAVPFGIESTQEMCMHFVSYYPRILKNITLGNQTRQVVYSWCGNYAQGTTLCGNKGDILDVENPVNRDPPGGANTTFGVASNLCPRSPSSSASASTSASTSASSSASSSASTSSASSSASTSASPSPSSSTSPSAENSASLPSLSFSSLLLFAFMLFLW